MHTQPPANDTSDGQGRDPVWCSEPVAGLGLGILLPVPPHHGDAVNSAPRYLVAPDDWVHPTAPPFMLMLILSHVPLAVAAFGDRALVLPHGILDTAVLGGPHLHNAAIVEYPDSPWTCTGG